MTIKLTNDSEKKDRSIKSILRIINAKIDRLDANHEAKLDKFDEKITARIDNTNEKVDKLDERINTIYAKLNALTDKGHGNTKWSPVQMTAMVLGAIAVVSTAIYAISTISGFLTKLIFIQRW